MNRYDANYSRSVWNTETWVQYDDAALIESARQGGSVPKA